MSTPSLMQLVPQPRLVPPGDDRALADLYAHEPGVVRANMVATVDGGAWGADHVSGSINDAADGRVFGVLRALADVVVIGGGTARAEGYTQLERPPGWGHLRPAPLELALVTRSGRVPAVLARAQRPPFVVTGVRGARAARAAVPADRVIVAGGGVGRGSAEGADEVDLAAALRRLAERGLGRVLTEGGPRLLNSLLAVGLVDELCVTTAPLLVGAGPGRIVADGQGELPVGPSTTTHLAHLLYAPGTGTLVARWALSPARDGSRGR